MLHMCFLCLSKIKCNETAHKTPIYLFPLRNMFLTCNYCSLCSVYPFSLSECMFFQWSVSKVFSLFFELKKKIKIYMCADSQVSKEEKLLKASPTTQNCTRAFYNSRPCGLGSRTIKRELGEGKALLFSLIFDPQKWSRRGKKAVTLHIQILKLFLFFFFRLCLPCNCHKVLK